MWTPNEQQKRAYYQAWATPERMQAKREAMRIEYEYRKSLGLCPFSGCMDDPQPGLVLCRKHAHASAHRRDRTHRNQQSAA